MLERITADIPGCGGVLKRVPDDFQVEELPAYLPSGTGEHLFLWVEKVGKDTAYVARVLAQQLGVPEEEVGYAGMKDRHARTWQFFSVPARVEAKVAAFAEEGVTVHSATRHGNKLKTGHLRGNRFRIRVRDAVDAGAARASLTALQARGFPNYFGEQRFGGTDDNASLGKQLLLGQRLARPPSRFQRRLYLSAFQSLLFNRALTARIQEGTFAQALKGDVLRKLDTGGLFVCAAPEEDLPRVARFEVSPAGPIFGPKMTAAEGDVARAEQALLEAEGLSLAVFKAGKGETEGARRTYRLPLSGVALAAEGVADLLLTFELPKGSYATVVMDELMKPLPAHAPEANPASR